MRRQNASCSLVPASLAADPCDASDDNDDDDDDHSGDDVGG